MINESFKTLPESYSETRRLAIERKIVDLINEGIIDENILINHLERWCNINKEKFKYNYIDATGLVSESLKHKSSINYLKVIEGKNLIKNIYGRRWMLTKHGVVLSKLKSNINSLELTLHEICFFLKILLNKDFSNIINLINVIKNENKFSNICKNFKDNIILELSSKEKFITSIRIQKKFQIRLNNMKNWSKNRLNHVIIPRLHWLIDLKLIDWEMYKKNEYFLNKNALIFLNELTIYKNMDIEKLLQEHYYVMFSKGFKIDLPKNLKLWSKLNVEEKIKISENCIEEGLYILGGHEVKRVSIIPLLEYYCNKLLIEDGIISSFNNLHEEIRNYANSHRYLTYRWIPYDKDGYIRKIG